MDGTPGHHKAPYTHTFTPKNNLALTIHLHVFVQLEEPRRNNRKPTQK